LKISGNRFFVIIHIPVSFFQFTSNQVISGPAGVHPPFTYLPAITTISQTITLVADLPSHHERNNPHVSRKNESPMIAHNAIKKSKASYGTTCGSVTATQYSRTTSLLTTRDQKGGKANTIMDRWVHTYA